MTRRRALSAFAVGAALIAVLSARPLAAAGTEERLAALVASGAPRGLVTVVVPVPDGFHGDEDVSFEVRATGEMEVLGRRAGLALVRGGTPRPLVLTLRVPAGADAGAIAAADVHFRSRERELVVPVVVQVALVRKVQVLGPRELRGLRLGDRITLAYRVVNGGNAADSLVVDVRGPLGWSVRLTRPARVVVPARGDVEVAVTLSVPGVANVGDHPLELAVRPVGGLETVASIQTVLGVIGRAGQVAGVVLKPSVALASGSDGAAFATGVVLEGAVAPETYLRAQFSPQAARGGLVTQGLSAVGAFATPFAATLAGNGWDIAAGNVGLQLADLTGVNVMGQGVSARGNRGRSEARMIAARPGAGRGATGSLAGVGYWRTTELGRIGGSVSHFSERRGFSSDRELTAVGVDYATNPVGTVTLGASLAHRSAGFTSGLGFGASVAHEREGERAVLRVSHAPGGTAAFARATDEVQLDLARAITPRWTADLSALRSTDAGPVFSTMRVSSLAVGQRYLLNDRVQLSLRGLASEFDASIANNSIGDFGAQDRSLSAGGEWRKDMLALTAEGFVGIVGRSTERFDGSDFRSAAGQRGARVGVSRAFERWGSVDGTGSLELTDAGVGIPAQMVSLTARWSAIPLNVLGRQARIGSELSYQRLGQLEGTLVTRANASVALPMGLELALSAERNPFFRDAQGRAGWVGAMRVSAATRVWAADALGPAGMVYEDRNLNGRRDEGEPGVPGVVVRRGESRGKTDRTGSYRLAAHARGTARIDQSTLPAGFVSHPLLATDSIERLDLPVLPTAGAVLDLVLAADAEGRTPVVDLEPAVVILRDATGFEWVGRRVVSDGVTRAEFHGIPIGRYEVVFNGTRLREPLRADEQVVELVPGQVSRLVVRLRARAVRIFTPSSNRSSSPAPAPAAAEAAAGSPSSVPSAVPAAAAAAAAPAAPAKATRVPEVPADSTKDRRPSVRTYYAPAARRQP